MTAISLTGVSKNYRIKPNGYGRLKDLLLGRPLPIQVALEPLDLDIKKCEVVGVLGKNGAGKSTLLKLIAGTLRPTTGSIDIDGRVCALLELGSGFHPELTGYENVELGGVVAGLTQQEIRERLEDIIEFSGLSDAMSRPLKTYSSGMVARLAFALATSVDPDILILDETLSVGDGQFAKKSFDRIMDFRDKGKTILFCSHSMYQVQAVCTRAIWIDNGSIQMDATPGEVISAYSLFLSKKERNPRDTIVQRTGLDAIDLDDQLSAGTAKILDVKVTVDGSSGSDHEIGVGTSDVAIETRISVPLGEPPPCLGIVVINGHGDPVTSVTSLIDGFQMTPDQDGQAAVSLIFERLSLMRGNYWVHVFLLCDRGIHIHDKARMVAKITVTQEDCAIGFVSLPHRWVKLVAD